MMRPRSGLTSPAIMLTRLVLPEPDGPNRAVTRLSVSNRAAIANSPSCFSTSTLSTWSASVQPRAGASREPFGGDKRDKRNRDCDDDKPKRRRVAARHLRIGVDRGRDGLGLSRN